MFSKFNYPRIIALWVVTALTLSACNTRIGEDPPAVDPYKYQGAACLSESGATIKKFIEGNAANYEVGALWDCVNSAVSEFKKNVQGSTKDQFTSQELATFLENNFIDQSKGPQRMSKELQLELMKVKTLLVGGTVQYVTRTELELAAKTFTTLRDVSITINPYMKVFAMNWSVSGANNMQKDMQFFEDANSAIQKGGETLASMIEKNGRSYVLSDFHSLLTELSKFLKENWAFTETVKKYMPVVQKIKKAISGGKENEVAPSEWPRFVMLGARGYVQYLRYYYFIQAAPETGTAYRLAYISRTVEDILSVFQDLVAKKPEGVVSRDEVTDLLMTLSKAWPDFKMSAPLVTEVMKVKQLFFGGSTDSFTTVDFNTARLKVSRLKALIERFMPYYAIYGGDWDPTLYSADEAQKIFMEAQFILEASGRELGVLVEGSYDLRDIVSLVAEFEKLYPPTRKTDSLTESLKKYIPVAIDAKNIFLGGDDSSIQQKQWSKVLSFITRFYSDYQYYQYFISKEKLNKPEPLGFLSVFMNQSLNLFKDLLQTKEGAKLSLAELSIVARHMINLKILPDGITQAAADKLVQLLVNNVMVDPERRLKGYKPNVLNVDSIEITRREMQVWLDTELFIAKLSQNWKPHEGIFAKDLIEIIRKGEKSDTATLGLREGLKELALVVDSPIPLAIDSVGRMLISNRFEAAYTQKSLTRVNMSRTISRIAIRSFARDWDRIKSYAGVNQDEVVDTFKDVKPIFVAMGLLDEKNDAFGASRFRDANLFTPHGNGDSLASFQEFTDLVTMIWSGLGINDDLKEDLIKDCLKGQVINAKTHVDVDCARKSYRKSMATYMMGTPEFLKYMKKPGSDIDGYLMNIFKAAGYVPNGKKSALLSDITLAPHVVQYIEMLFARFDKNGDMYISKSDALRAYPLFEPILLEFAKDQINSGKLSREDLKAVFCYMLYYGKAPETKTEQLIFWWKWKGEPDNWDQVSADRTLLAQILGYIADKTAGTPVAEIPGIEKDLPPGVHPEQERH